MFLVGEEETDDEQLKESYELMLSFERLVIGLEFALGLELVLEVESSHLRSKRGATHLGFELVESFDDV